MFRAVRSLEDADASELTEGEIREEALGRVPYFSMRLGHGGG